jgi:hypothetical protein
VNKELALENIRRIRGLLSNSKVQVLIAHDVPWYKEDKGGPVFYPEVIPAKVRYLERWHTMANFVSYYLTRWKHHSTARNGTASAVTLLQLRALSTTPKIRRKLCGDP